MGSTPGQVAPRKSICITELQVQLAFFFLFFFFDRTLFLFQRVIDKFMQT